MININGKEWNNVTTEDILTALGSLEMDESFFFEFKDDRVSPKKLIEEISAFANSFGGYIFIGVSDEKEIEGCTEWNEQRIHSTIHDSITPTPVFDIKKIVIQDKTVVFVLRIEPGPEPPYITNQGKICERLSSGSFVVKDSGKLSQIYVRRENQLKQLEKKLEIPAFVAQYNNVHGYIDVGFAVFFHDIEKAYELFNAIKIKVINHEFRKKQPSSNAFFVGDSILFTPGGLHSDRKLPAHMNNFLEIMADGSARMRVLLSNNDAEQATVNLYYAKCFFSIFKEFYNMVFSELYPNQFIYAKKYESLTVLTQFQPQFFYDETVLEKCPQLEKDNSELLEYCAIEPGISKEVVTNDRIPKTGFYTIDKRNILKWYKVYSKESISDELFFSRYANMMQLQGDDHST